MTKKTAKTGRPSKYSDKLIATICARIMQGESTKEIGRDPAMPTISTIFKWLAEKPEFTDRYTRAKAVQADYMAEEMLDIADDGENDWMRRNGKDEIEGYVVNGEHIQRSKLRLETRKWLMGKQAAKKYGDKLDVDVTAKMNITIAGDDKDL